MRTIYTSSCLFGSRSNISGNTMRTLKDLLPTKHRIARKKSKVFSIDEKTVFYVVRKIIQEEYGLRGGENIIPTLYKDKIIFLSSISSLWGNEIWIERERLRGKINLLLGDEVIREIKIARGSL